MKKQKNSKKIWIEDKTYIHPINFKDLFGHFVKQFSGFSQQDSHEMLTFMLDNIHEDLNRNLEKKYCELKEQSDMIRNESDLDTKMSYIPSFLTNLADMESHLFKAKLFYDDYRKSVTGLMNYLLLRARLPLIYIKPIELDNYYEYINLANESFDNSEIETFYKEKMCDSIESDLILPMKNSMAHYVDVNNKQESGLLENKILTFKQNKYK